MRPIVRYGVILVVLLTSVLVLPRPGFAGWESANVTAVDIKKVCKNGIKFDAAVRNGEHAGEYLSYAVVTDSNAPSVPVPEESVVLRTRISMPQLNKPKDVDLPGGGKLTVSHLRSFQMSFYADLAVGSEIALNVEDFKNGSGYSVGAVANCNI